MTIAAEQPKVSTTSDWSESIQTVLEQPPAALPSRLVFFGLVFFGVFSLWAWVGNIQEVSRATGQLIPEGETYKVEPTAAGKVNQIMVKEGDVVNQGDLLFGLEATSIESEIARLVQTANATRQELAQVQQMIVRTSAERATQQMIGDAIVQSQLASWAQSQASLQTNQGLLIDLRSETAAYEERLSRLSSLESQGAISREYLFEVEQGVRTQYKTMKQTQGALVENQAQTEQIEAELAKNKAEMQQTMLGTERSLQETEMKAQQLEAKLIDTQTLLEEAKARLAHTQVRSPASGIVSSLNIDNIGEFAQVGSTLVEIVPADTPLVLKTVVPTQKAGLIETGMDAKIKLDAFPYQSYGVLSGTVVSISPDARSANSAIGIRGDTGAMPGSSGYQVEIALEEDYVMHEGNPVNLQMGQTASAEIVVRNRRIIDLVLDPIRRLSADDLTL